MIQNKRKSMKSNIINIDPEIMGGTPVFMGTRVPIQTLFDNLEEMTLDNFLVNYPTVSRQQVIDLLHIAAKKTIPKTRKYYAAAS
jgi:uncharacterized protein (DUF433 family)